MSKAALGVLYASIFVVGVPLALVACARSVESALALPEARLEGPGLALTLAGAGLMIAAMHALLVRGGGFPISAFPPPKLVTTGPYLLFGHPIYVGFCLMVLGIALRTGSRGGLWVAFPMACLGCAALVYGYEEHDLDARFGCLRPRPRLRLPPSGDARPTSWHRAAVYLRVLVPWLGAYALASLGQPEGGKHPRSPADSMLDASVLLLVLAVPCVSRTQRALRRFGVDGLLALAGFGVLWMAWPPIGIRWACPVWALLVARALGGPALWVWAAVIVVNRLRMHEPQAIAASIAVALLVVCAQSVWSALRRWAERVANSWREWHLGSIRFINHGIYAGLGTFVGLFIVGALSGRGSAPAILVISVCTLITSALWAQWIEGASGLSRPYGFYGGLLGASFGCALGAWLVGKPVWLLLAATCVSGPWVQAFGRLRCLVQGCCHGAPASPAVGIRYTHERSRVSRAPALAGVPLHPTPLYSILWNGVTALALVRLWLAHAPLPVVGGSYLVLNGVGRFVEESYRGEPQTPVVARLRLYQWIAIGSVLIGMSVLVFGKGGPGPTPVFDWTVLVAALVGGVGNVVALGVDFPRAQWRFSRLA